MRTSVAWLGLAIAIPAAAQQPPAASAAAATSSGQSKAVPNVVGLRLDSAQRILAARNLSASVARKADGSSPSPGDIVAQQRPAAGQPIPFVPSVTLTLRATAKPPGGTVDSVASEPPSQRARVPNVTGLSLDSARRVLQRSNLTMRVSTRPQGVRPAGTDIVSLQSPQARQPVPADGGVAVVVAIDLIRVPDVTGLTLSAARSQLARLQFRAEIVPNAATPNTIFRQDPAPQSLVRPASLVTLYIAQAAQPTQRLVPNVVGRQLQDATALLAQYGFQPGLISDDDDANVAANVVVSQDPPGGQSAEPRSRIALTVRTNRVRVPAVLSLTESDARQRIGDGGLRVGAVETREDTAAAGTVIQQSIDARTLVERGSIISIVVARPVAAITPTPTPPTTPPAQVVDSTRATAPIAPETLRVAPTGTQAPVSPAATQSIIVPDIVGLTRAQAEAVATRAGFTLIVAPGQSARDADTVVAQTPLARATVTNGSLILMAQFNPAGAPTRSLWVIWVALAIPLIAAISRIIIKKRPTPPEIALPPITYAAGAKPPTFSVDDRRLTRGLELSLAVKHDPGVQMIADTRRPHDR